MLEAQRVCKEKQWLGMKELLQKRERKWNAHTKDDILYGTGISDIARKILLRMRAGETQPKADSCMHVTVQGGTIQQV